MGGLSPGACVYLASIRPAGPEMISSPMLCSRDQGRVTAVSMAPKPRAVVKHHFGVEFQAFRVILISPSGVDPTKAGDLLPKCRQKVVECELVPKVATP